MNHGHTLLIDGTRRRAPELERAAGARLLACWCTLLDLGTNAPPSEGLRRANTHEPRVEKFNGMTPVAAKKRRISQPIARKTDPGDPLWPQEPPRPADSPHNKRPDARMGNRTAPCPMQSALTNHDSSRTAHRLKCILFWSSIFTHRSMQSR